MLGFALSSVSNAVRLLDAARRHAPALALAAGLALLARQMRRGWR